MTSANAWQPHDVDFWKASTESAATNPGTWLYAADRLHRAAQALREILNQDFADMPVLIGRGEPLPIGIGPVMLMLYGLELENLVKGLIIAKDPDKGQSSGTKLAVPVKWHLNTRLFSDAGVALSADEEAQVVRLRTFIDWGGRYPVATDALAMAYAHPTPPPASFTTDDLPMIDVLIDRVRRELVSLLPVRGAFDEAAKQAALRAKRPTVLAGLQQLRQEEKDGMTFFFDDSQPDEPGAALACLCGMQFTFNKRRPGAICGCGTLHVHEEFWDSSLQRTMPKVVQYPAP